MSGGTATPTSVKQSVNSNVSRNACLNPRLSTDSLILITVLKEREGDACDGVERSGERGGRDGLNERVARSEVGDPLQTSGDRKSEEVSDGATEDGDVGMDELELESGDWDGEVSESEDGEAVTSMGSVPMKSVVTVVLLLY